MVLSFPPEDVDMLEPPSYLTATLLCEVPTDSENCDFVHSISPHPCICGSR